ncbi:putative Golgi matrix protein [Lepidopterella palustris CBS 459.81]|uniref:Putative Golgi matrix protein n=1 Tax=Lepidopterella palustris CBS 459.81 TaxID=1314670 RepID=A0A8E2JIA8_9PEZI|nr:putative Golgi matrix protein [Lepidopterella palustris CBS 459.81]
MANTTSPPSSSDTSKVLDALLTERDTLRAEVTELRKSLEDIQGKHEEELANVQEQVEEAQAGKDHFEAQYQNLLGRVNGIRTSLGDRLKADAAKLEEALAQVEVLEERNRSIEEANSTLLSEISKLRQHSESQAAEIASLRSRASISQQNWIKERDELIQREAFAREEFQNAKQAMQDWEVLAMDERSLRESLGDRISELEEQLGAQKEAYERAASERDIQSTTVDGLQRALQEVQNARKTERRELVEQSQAQLEELRKQLQIAEEASSASKAALEMTQKELERALPFEKEVKEKNLLIGKLRHEAVTLNDHLTKALRILRKGKPEDNVDRQIVTNYLLHFLAIDRTDPKKFEALQLIAALLNWTDEQREQAGLARPGTSNSSLRIPLSPFRRTPSTPALSADSLLAANSRNSKESLAELWSSFLEQEAAPSTLSSPRPLNP